MSRLTIEFTDEAERQIGSIQRSIGVSTRAAVIQKALGLLGFMVEERKCGGRILVDNERDNTRKEIMTL